jgi:O-antigen/teichoic acid export membrane protein
MSRLMRNILANVVGQGLVLLLGFVSVKLVFSRLGEDALGIVYVTLALSTALVGLFEAGVAVTAIREVSSHAERDPEYIRDLIRTGTLLYAIGYVAVAALAFFGAPVIVHRWIHLSTMDPGDAVWLLRAVSLSALLGLPRTLYVSVLRGLQRMGTTNVVDVTAAAAQQLGLALILLAGGGLVLVGAWFVVSFAAALAVYLVLVGRAFGASSLAPRWSPRVFRKNKTYSRDTMSISVLSVVHTQTDKVVLSRLLPVATVGFYGFAYGVVGRLSLVTDAIAQAAFPAFSSSASKGDRAGLLARYRPLHELVCLGLVPLFAAVAFAARPLFALVLDADASASLAIPVALLAVGFYLHATITLPYFAALATGRADIPARLNLAALLVVLPLTLALVFAFGILGAALGWIAYHLFWYAAGIPPLYRGALGLPARAYFAQLARPLALAVPTYAAPWILLEATGRVEAATLALAFLAGTLAYAGIAAVLASAELKAALRRAVRRSDAPRPVSP